MRNTLVILLATLALISCAEKRTVTPAIYYWKTIYTTTEQEKQHLSNFGCKTVYLRYFDVGWDVVAGQPKPNAVIDLPADMDSNFSYIPVVFLTQDMLLNLEKRTIGPLAGNISSLVGSISENAGIKKIEEIQIDCDWTSKTRDRYFALLGELKRKPFFAGKMISATIRMHQVKYRSKNGIPPVERGLLMCYNMGNIKDPSVRNSILDHEVAEQYLQNMESYPLPLDIALPLFDWSLQFRNGKLQGILRGIHIEKLRSAPFMKKENDNIFTCTADTMWERYDLQKGDQIRWEESSCDEIEQIAAYTAKRLHNKELDLVFFHWDSVTLSKHPPYELEKIVDIYR